MDKHLYTALLVPVLFVDVLYFFCVITCFVCVCVCVAAYDFLAVEHANKDMVKDIIFIYKSSEGRTNNTCENEGKARSCHTRQNNRKMLLGKSLLTLHCPVIE